MAAYNAKMRVWRGDASGGELKDYTVEVGLNDKNEMRSMSINGSFFDSSDATYNLEMSKFGQKATISKPA